MTSVEFKSNKTLITGLQKFLESGLGIALMSVIRDEGCRPAHISKIEFINEYSCSVAHGESLGAWKIRDMILDLASPVVNAEQVSETYGVKPQKGT